MVIATLIWNPGVWSWCRAPALGQIPQDDLHVVFFRERRRVNAPFEKGRKLGVQFSQREVSQMTLTEVHLFPRGVLRTEEHSSSPRVQTTKCDIAWRQGTYSPRLQGTHWGFDALRIPQELSPLQCLRLWPYGGHQELDLGHGPQYGNQYW